MDDDCELVDEYCQSLNDLKSNSKPMIKVLTMLAGEYAKVDKEIVERIKDMIYDVETDRKLLFLYLIDSICKCVGLNYVELFSKYLVQLFVHVYSAGDMNIKNSLIKLRRTWNTPDKLFESEVLSDLDTNVKYLDSNWPFAQRINEITNSSTRSNQQSSPASNLLKSPDQQNLLFEIDQHYHLNSQKQNNQHSNLLNNANDAVCQQTISNSAVHFNYINQNQQLTQFNDHHQFNYGQQTLSANVSSQFNSDYKNTIDYHLDKIYNTGQPSININSSFINNNSFLNYNHHNQTHHNQNGSFNNKQSKATYEQKYNRMPKNHIRANDYKNNKTDNSPSFSRKRSIEERSISYGYKRSPLTNLNTRSNYDQKNFNRSSSYNQQKHQFVMPANNQLAKPLESQIMFEGRYYKIYHLDENTSIILMNCPANLTFDQIQNQYQNAYDLDPRLVYFEGNPVNVHIDERETIFLLFNNLWKSFYINGCEQLIKFGGPGREVHLNNQILSASFGGPPVSCVLNGDSSIHTLRLDNPAPRIKLSDQPRVDIWYSIVKKYRSSVNHSQNLNHNNNRTAITRQPNQYLMQQPNQFTRLQDSYHQSNRPCIKTSSTELTDLVNSIKSFSNSPNQDPAFCPLTYQNADHEKLSEESDDLELTKESLNKKRPHLIDSLYKGLQCTSCSLRFNVDSSEKKRLYSKHLDWHFRKNRKSRSTVVSNLNRDWYYPFSLWSQFKEINLDIDDKTEESKKDNVNLNAIKEVAVKLVPIKSNSNDSLNFCSTCFERFDQIWSDDEDEWLLSKAVLINDKYYHSICIPSAHPAEESSQQESELTEDVINLVEIEKDPVDTSPEVIVLSDAKINDMNSVFDTQPNLHYELKETTNRINSLDELKSDLNVIDDSLDDKIASQLLKSVDQCSLDAIFDHDYCNPPFHNNKDISSLCSIM